MRRKEPILETLLPWFVGSFWLIALLVISTLIYQSISLHRKEAKALYRVTLWDGKEKVREWEGRWVQQYTGLNGWYFKDAKSGEQIRVSGTVTVEPIPSP